MSATFSDSSQVWRPIQRVAPHTSTERAPSANVFWDNMVSFTSLLSLIGMIAYLILR